MRKPNAMTLPQISDKMRAIGYILGGATAAVVVIVQAIQVAGWPARITELEAAQRAYVADSIPARVTRLERQGRGVEYLVCRAAREDSGLDPRDCRERIRDLDDYLTELAR